MIDLSSIPPAIHVFIIELNKISKEKEIICVIGTFDPEIYGIPFIPIENIFNSTCDDLSTLLDNKNVQEIEFINNSKVIFEHLGQELKNIDCVKLEMDLVNFITNIEIDYGKKIEMNEKVGLLVHLACAVDKLKEGLPSVVNPFRQEIINKNMSLYRILEKHIASLERDFMIKFNQDELSNIICIIKKSKKG